MKLCITKIHLGRYKIDMLDENNQILSGYDCGSAGVMVALNNWMFVPEHLQYMADQRKSSAELGEEAIRQIKTTTVTCNGCKETFTADSFPLHAASCKKLAAL
jgi:hypothetical protein